MRVKHHEEQVESILNYLEELSFHCIKKMEERLVNGWIVIPRDFDEVKTKLKEARTQIRELQKKCMRQRDKIAFIHFRISDLEMTLEDIQDRFPAQSVGSSNTYVLDLLGLLVLITGTSQSRQHGVAIEDPTVQSLLALRKVSKESRFEHIRQEMQAGRGEGSSDARDDNYKFEDFSKSDIDATRNSSWLKTKKDDDKADTKDLDIDIFDDDFDKEDDDAVGFEVFMHNKSKELPKFTPISCIVTYSSMKISQISLMIHLNKI
uniref:Uncharacterized protein n=1 Tax=Tanacetum cinerariifolium TaxID=118510 RepID=A0A6L2MG65_TANCI|nr:hypothetical protein [Tanacetum cinerariifolium]